MPKHLVFGAGLIGCYLGASLQHKKQNVVLLCRQQTQQKLLNGITLTNYLEHRAEIKHLTFLTPETQSQNEFDIVWLTVKCTGVDSALDQLQSVVGKNTTVICCQNGLGSETAIKHALPNNRILRAMVPFNVVEIDDGHFHRGSEGTFTIEKTPQSANFVEQLAAEINSSILPVSTYSDMTSLLWAKLQLNLGNSINALANIPVKEMLQQRKYRLVIAQMMRELLLVTQAKAIRLPKITAIPAQYLPFILSLPNCIFKIVANRMLAIDENVRTSMWWDIFHAKQTEITYLNGAIVEQGKLLGIDTPVNIKVIALVQQLSNSNFQKNKTMSAQQLYNLVMQEPKSA